MGNVNADDAAKTTPVAPAVAPVATPSPAVDPEDVFEPRVFKNASGATIPYRLLKPLDFDASDNQKKYPLVLFLHGAGERGVDNSLQFFHGGPVMASMEFRRRYLAFVVVPQCPAEKRWVEVPWEGESHTMLPEPSESLALTYELLASLRQEFPIDADRIYGVGLSMGAFGVWDILQRNPELLAAAAPICGGGDPAYAPRFKSTPVWAFHGDADTTVKVNRSREMVKALTAAGGRLIYTEYEGVGHDSWTATFENRLMWDWLFAQRRDP